MRLGVPAYVGRDHELAVLDRILAGAAAGSGAAVFVVGDPGMGKSRLAAQAAELAAERGLAVLRGRAAAVGPPVRFQALTAALLSLARGVEDLVARLGPYRPILGHLVPDWSLDEAADDPPVVVLAEAVLRFTAIVGERRGALLIVDDLHDADQETVAVLEHLTTNLTGLPVAVLVALRPDPSSALDLTRATASRGDGLLLELPPLTRAEVRRLVASCLGVEPAEVSDEVVDQLVRDGGGVPFYVEELVRGLVDGGRLVRQSDGWHLTAAERAEVPPAVAYAIARRADRLDPGGQRVLATAALLGVRFSITVLADLVGQAGLTDQLRRAVDARLLTEDDEEPGWLAFRHPLTAQALLTTLDTGRRATLSRAAADAVRARYPDLPDRWCRLLAQLERLAGDHWSAAGRHVTMAERALAGGAPGTAIALLDAGDELLGERRADPEHRGQYEELLWALLRALAETGEFDRATEVAGRIAPISVAPTDPIRLELSVRLAWAAWVAARWDEGRAHVEAARSLLDAASPRRLGVEVDAVDAYLTMASTDHGRIRHGARLARRAIAGAEELGLPVVACQAWYAVGFLTRDRDMSESDGCFRRMLDLATEHGLAKWRLYALVGLAGNAWLTESDAGPMRFTMAEAMRIGELTVAYNVNAILGLDAVLREEFDRAEPMLTETLVESSRLRLGGVKLYTLMALAVLAAHRGRRDELRRTLGAFQEGGGDAAREAPLAKGLATVFFALLEENRAEAEAELAVIAGTPPLRQGGFYLAGQSGLKPLLDVLAGRCDRAELNRFAASPAGRLRWNRQFLQLADAVLLGRAGSPSAAMARAGDAMRSAGPFPLARNLGIRLIAEEAIRNGWGTPRTWLREAEEYFHHAGMSPVASACRVLMRQVGEPVRQRRAAAETVPEHLRRLGITAREYEVLRLLPRRPTNRSLAERLHISPRTAEKHIASLIVKTGSANRADLADRATDLTA